MIRLPTFLLSIAAFSLILSLSGCGQSGPLYIPGNPSQITVPPSETPADEEEKETSDPSTTD